MGLALSLDSSTFGFREWQGLCVLQNAEVSEVALGLASELAEFGAAAPPPLSLADARAALQTAVMFCGACPCKNLERKFG